MCQSWVRSQSVNSATLLFERPAAEVICARLDATLTTAAADAGITGRPEAVQSIQTGPRSRDFCLRPSVTVKRCRSRRQALTLDPRLQLETK
jgi:hypothetical protein